MYSLASFPLIVGSMVENPPLGVTYTDITGDPNYIPFDSDPMDAYLLKTFQALQRTRRAAVTIRPENDTLVKLSASLPSGSFRGTGFYDNRHFHSLPAVVSVMNGALVRSVMGPQYSIETINWPLNKSLDNKITDYLRSGTDLTVAINVIIALSFVPASFVVYLVNERISKAKHLQFVSGVTPPIYWLSTFLW